MSPQRLSEIGEKTKISLSMATLGAILAAGLAFAGTAYSARGAVIGDMKSVVTDQLKSYVTRDEWYQWQISESEKRDRQFQQLLSKLDRIGRR